MLYQIRCYAFYTSMFLGVVSFDSKDNSAVKLINIVLY